jgi:hypothetical protein
LPCNEEASSEKFVFERNGIWLLVKTELRSRRKTLCSVIQRFKLSQGCRLLCGAATPMEAGAAATFARFAIFFIAGLALVF